MFDWITGFVDAIGPLGVAFLMFVENVFPPIPSELIMPLAGFNAAQGKSNLAVTILAGSIGSLAGAVMWYYIGRAIGYQRLCRLSHRHGRWLTVSPHEFDQANAWFERHGGVAVLIGRLIPTIRTFISVPAGIARMPMPVFVAYSAVGTVAWTALLAGLGYVLEAGYERVEVYLNPISTAVFVAILAFYIYRVVTFERRQST